MHIDRMLFGMGLGALLFLLCYPLFFRRLSVKKKIFTGLLFVYVGALLFLTMLFAPPWAWDISAQATRHAISRINLRPMVSSMEIYRNCARIGNYKDFYILIGGNLALLMPLGILVPLLNHRFRFLRICGLAAAVAASIEGLQLLWNILLGDSYRTVEMDDFILNVAGCVAAYLIFSAVKHIFYTKRCLPDSYDRNSKKGGLHQ